MPARIPLYVRILGWFFLNVAVLTAGVWLAVRQGRIGEWFVRQQAEPRLQPVTRLLMQELQRLPQEDWNGVLAKYAEAHSMSFAVFSPNGRQIAGVAVEPPLKIRNLLSFRPPGQPRGQREPLPGGSPGPQVFRPDGQPLDPDGRRPLDQRRFIPLPAGAPPPAPPQSPNGPEGNPQGPAPPGATIPGPGGPRPRAEVSGLIIEHTEDPSAWWFVCRMTMPPGPRPSETSLVLRTESLTAGGLLGDLTPWWRGAAGLLLVSALLWFPFVHGVTVAIGKMRKATARIAGGAFDVSVPDKRRDELGELAGGINQMAARLSGFVTGQKRFLGDIAHELCSPLARMQMAGAALEQRAPEELQPRIADLTAEMEAMSQLVGELLDFSRAGLAPQSVALTDMPLLPLVEQITAREEVAPDRVTLDIPSSLTVRAHAGLLSRALGNVVRNALRYAGPEAHLEITAQPDGARVLLTVADNGPGVPAEALPSLFDPFFRMEAARDRASGGTGLGLAIVRTCVESCGGVVTAHNRRTGGLEIQFRLPC